MTTIELPPHALESAEHGQWIESTEILRTFAGERVRIHFRDDSVIIGTIIAEECHAFATAQKIASVGQWQYMPRRLPATIEVKRGRRFELVWSLEATT